MGRDELDKIVYFAFDKSTLSREARAILNAYAERFKTDGGRIVLEGHADEKGTREYNLALGERRASAAKKYLASSGVKNSRITTISYGKERPAVIGSYPSAWAQNRRSVTTIN